MCCTLRPVDPGNPKAVSDASVASPPATSFRSAIGKRYWFQMAGPLMGLAGIAMGTASWLRPHSALEISLVVLGYAVAALALGYWILRGVRYTVEGDTLVVRRQWLTRRISLEAIAGLGKVEYSGSWLSNLGNDFALGSAVLEIRYDDDAAVLVSPLDEDAFLHAMGRGSASSRSTA